MEEVKNIAAINEESLILARLLFISNNNYFNNYNKKNINVCSYEILWMLLLKEMNNRLFIS